MALPSSGELSLADIRAYIVGIAEPNSALAGTITLNQLATTLAVTPNIGAFYSYDLNLDKNIYLAALRANMYPTTLTTAEFDAVNDLFSDLDNYGIYSKITAFYPMLGTTSVTQCLNAKSSGGVRQSAYDLVFFGGWSFASNGAQGNGSNTYWLVNYNYTDTTILDSHFGVYQTSAAYYGINGGYDIALYEYPVTSNYSPVAFSHKYLSSGYTVFNYDYPDHTFFVYNDPASSIMSYDNANTRAELYQNGSSIDAYAVAPPTLPTTYVGGGYEYPNGSYTDKTFGFITFGQYLTSTEMANYQAAINGFQTTLGRNIY